MAKWSSFRVSAVVWSAVAWLAALDSSVTAFINRAPTTWWRGLVPPLAEWYLWVPLTPAVLWLGRRFPVSRGGRWWVYIPHLVAIVMASALRGAVYFWTATNVEKIAFTGTTASNLERMVLGFMPIAAILYCGILAVQMAVAYAERSRAGELRAAQLQAQLARAELRALQANLHPHFLFNALHSVSALVRTREPAAAVDVIAELSELLRYVLQREAPEEVALADELSFVRRYLGIEQVRFSDRLRVTWQIDPDVLPAVVPRLVLQPLVENAVRHGVARSSAAGTIGIDARRNGSWLELTVRDDGPGPQANSAAENGSSGWGLSATRARLVQAYGPMSGVTLAERSGGGTIAAVRLPFHVFSSADDAEDADA